MMTHRKFSYFVCYLWIGLVMMDLITAPVFGDMPIKVWDVEKLSQPPVFRWVDEKSPVRSLIYTAEPYQGKPSEVFAYYASPATLEKRDHKDDEKFPGIVLIHGGGGTAFKVWAELWAKRGYAAIAMDLAGSRPDEANPKQRTRLPDGGPDQSHQEKFTTIETLEDVTDDWPYHAVANSILAHSLLRSFPEVDPDRTAVTGISWGGYTTCIVSAVDSRFKAAVPVYGCGFLHHNSTWLKEFERLSFQLTAEWVRRYDPGIWLPHSKVPTFFINGTNDFAYPLDSFIKSYHVVPAFKNIRVQVNMPHGHEVGWAPKEIGLFIDHQLALTNAKALPRISQVPEILNSHVQARLVSQTKLIMAELVYSVPETPKPDINKHKWKTVAAVIEVDPQANSTDSYIIKAPVPPEDSDVIFFTVTDERDAMVSSPVFIR